MSVGEYSESPCDPVPCEETTEAYGRSPASEVLGRYDPPRPSVRETGLSIEVIENGIIVFRNRAGNHEFVPVEKHAFVRSEEAIEYLSDWLVEIFPPGCD